MRFFFPEPQSDVHNPLAVYLLFFSLSAPILVARLSHPLSLSVSLGDCVCVCGGCDHFNNAVGINTMLVLRLSRFNSQALSREGFVFTVHRSGVNTLPSVHFWPTADSLVGNITRKFVLHS